MNEIRQDESGRALWDALQETPDLRVVLSGHDVWILVSAIQLTTTHPNVGVDLARRLERLGRLLGSAFDGQPAVAALLEAGWDRSQDVDAQGNPVG